MAAVARGAALGASNPLLSEYIAIDGKLVEPFSLSWSIYDISTGAKEDDPDLVEGVTTVDLDADKVSPGRYAVTWTVPADEAIGKHQIVWTAVLVEDGPAVTWRRDFDVVQHPGLALGGYALVSDLRDEGVTTTQANNARLARLIRESSEFIDRVTGVWFEGRADTSELDGTGRDTLFLQTPTVAIESVALGDSVVASEGYKVYGGWSSPNDRWTPRITRVSALLGTNLVPASAWGGSGYSLAVWPRHRQNVAVTGVFGFLEPDGSPVGGTPPLIRKACMMLVIRNLAPMADADAVHEAKNKHRIVSERTREQSYELARGGGAVGDGRNADFTGDPDIDSILEMYSRPPYVGFAAA